MNLESKRKNIVGKTSIPYAHYSFNYWTGCTKISPGCLNCYAETTDKRASAKVKTEQGWGPGKPRKLNESTWKQPLFWNKKSTIRKTGMFRVLCGTTCDVFDAEVPPEWREALFKIIKDTPNLIWMVLTKRAANIKEMLPKDWGEGYPNVWLGVTTEDRTRFDERVPLLREIPATAKFLSAEPLLESLRGVDLTGIDWVVTGSESGGKHVRITKEKWFTDLRDDCYLQDVVFFFSQWGSYGPDETYAGVKQRAGGIVLRSQICHNFPAKGKNR